MQNKIIILIVIILNLSILNAQSNDQITFDVSELEILDGGNKIIGKNRGIITTDNNMSIMADRFEYDKGKNVLQANGDVIIEDQINNYNFFAEDILYFKNDEKIEIKGKSKALLNKNYEFEIDNVVINRNDMRISSDVGGTILDIINLTRYEIERFSYSLKDKI